MGKAKDGEIAARQGRSRAKCSMYDPTAPDSAKCRHYGGEGICLHEREFLCVVWADTAAIPVVEKKNSAFRGTRRWLEEAGQKPSFDEVKKHFIATGGGKSLPVVPEQAAARPEPARRQASMKDAAPQGASGGEPNRHEARQTGSREVYDLRGFGVEEETGERLLLKNPELLTEEAIERLNDRGLEVTVRTARGVEVVLTPEYTEQRRSELTYRDARTLVMVMQVFPGATIDEINRFTKDEGED